MRILGIYLPLLLLALGVLETKGDNWLERSKKALLDLRGSMYSHNKADIIFLLDASASLNWRNFHREKKFIRNLLNKLSVAYEATRVEVIPFGRKAWRYIKFISEPAATKNKCTFKELFDPLEHAYGKSTNMKQAFELAYDVCFNGLKRLPLDRFKTVIILLTDGHWNYPWYSSPSPVAKAQELIKLGVEIFAFGVGKEKDVKFANLQAVVANQNPNQNHAFHIKNFDDFNSLATYIRGDRYELKWQIKHMDGSKCKPTCDKDAKCSCGLVYGDYKCSCKHGWYGTGDTGNCKPCPPGTYKDFEGHTLACDKCPLHSFHEMTGQTSRNNCKCRMGYEGQPENGGNCTIRKCPLITPPSFGKLKGGFCNLEYGNTCTVDCEEGHRLTGSATRRCVFQENPVPKVFWDGTVADCPLIQCNQTIVENTKVPRGTCLLPNGSPSKDYEYTTVCTYTCRTGYRYTGDLERRCQINGEWSGTKPTCAEVRCEKLPTVAVGRYIPVNASCDARDQKFDTLCTHVCPSGYHMHPGSNVDTNNAYKCSPETGKWIGIKRPCKDHQPPELTCPTKDLTLPNDKGKKTANATWMFTFDDNSLRAGGTSRDDFRVILLINGNETDPASHKTLELGRNRLQYHVTDPAGNFETCKFTIRVEDTEPPTCTFCPSDIVKENIPSSKYTASWDNPKCTDNSDIPPHVSPSLPKATPFTVPGMYSVIYAISDAAGNKYYNCSFTIKLTQRSCKKYPFPNNGGLTCWSFNGQKSCTASCNRKYDFASEPAFSYICAASGSWVTHPAGMPMPWPHCSKRNNPSQIKLMGLPGFFYDGNCNDEDVQAKLKKNFITVMNLPMVPAGFCRSNKKCTEENLKVHCGKVDAATRRRKRATTMKITFKVEQIEKSDEITPGSDAANEIDLYNKLKRKVEAEKTQVYNGLQKIDWGVFKTNSGMDLGGGADKFNLNVEAYCSVEGAVVRKCNKNDWEYQYYGKCNKKQKDGDITKCIRCPVGTYYNKDKEDCALCPEGQYMNHEGALKCFLCPKGTWTFGANKANFTSCRAECGPGYHSTTGIARCFPCPAGTYSTGRRNKKCITCPSGTTSTAAASKRLEDCGMQCAVGTYSHNGVEPCKPCPIGTYQNSTGRITCLPCPGRLSTYGPGAEHLQTCVEVNDCVSSPCNNHGRCVDTKESYRCECLSGFLGRDCENEADECAKKPCFGGATCVNRVGGYVCLCPPNFSGAECDKPLKVCRTQNPCVRGKCLEKASGMQCECPVGYEGDFCEIDVDECASNPCQNNAVCIGGTDMFRCICRSGFSGQLCQVNHNDCGVTNPCYNGGSCVDGQRFFTCQCRPGYTGARCEAEVDECQMEPCQNGGKCIEMFNGYQCSCLPGYGGKTCTKILSSDYDLSFQNRVSKPYAKADKVIPDLTAVTVILWVRTVDEKPGTALSYAVQDGAKLNDNAMALQDFSGLNLFINNEAAFLDIDIADGFWHHVAVTWHSGSGAWKAYVDGKVVKSSTTPFQQHHRIRGGGVMIVGQDQDELESGFNTEECFIGDLSQLNVWGRVLSDNEIYNQANSCADAKGDVVTWADFRDGLTGLYSVTSTSYACRFNNVRRYFTQTNNASIPNFNDKIISSTTPEACAIACDRETGFQCRSFDFDKNTKRCYLSTKHAANNVISYDATARYDYYELNCLSSVGVEFDKVIPDDKMTASSSWSNMHLPKAGRLRNQLLTDDNGQTIQVGAWVAKYRDASQWMQVEFAGVMRVSGVATQGRQDYASWVKSYKLQYSLDNIKWTTYTATLRGNSDQNTVVRNEVRVFRAKYIRFLPQTWEGYVAMRVEAYGCPDRKNNPSDTVNECISSPCMNGGVCVNKLSGYLCRCPRGYTGQRCATALPCRNPGTPVYGTKSSSNYQSGSTITFRCRAGYALVGPTSRTCQRGDWTGTQPRCEDVNECAGNHGCSHLCINTHGSFKCACSKGYTLHSDKHCNDINECVSDNGGCSHSCHNKYGSVTCSCPSGLVLTKGDRACVDINECTRNNGGCQHACVNKHRSYHCLCHRGFRLNSNGKNCDPLSCPSLPPVSNGQVQKSSNFVGATAAFTCNAGYRVIGSKTRLCQADTTWSGIQPTCARVYCREVGQVKNAVRSLHRYRGDRPVVGSTARFTCNANHVIQGSRDLVCQPDGVWSGDLPRCIPAFCAKLNAPAHGQIQGFRFELGATLRVTCSTGYNLKPAASSFRTCVSGSSGGGKWSEQDPTCELVDCGDPGDPYGGYRAIPGGTKYLAVATYTCQSNHHLQGEHTRTCQASGLWSGIKPVCLKHSCGYMDAPKDGKKHGNAHNYGKNVTFECNTGYHLIGSTSRTCQTNGLWTGNQPTCQVVSCGDPGTPVNGIRYGDKLTYKSILYFECDPGFRLSGTMARGCQADGTWSGTQSSCKPTNCGDLRTGPSGTITSFSHQGQYRNNEYCTWEIRVPENKKVRLDFEEFRTVAGEDFLFVYDTGSHQPIVAFDGTRLPLSYTSSGRSLRLRFITNEQNTMKGFKVHYKQIDQQCGGTLTSSSGTFQSPNFPNSYDSFGFNLDCVWLIVRPKERVELSLAAFDTEQNYDTLSIHQGRNHETMIANERSGMTIPTKPYVAYSYVWIHFKTNYMTTGNPRKGWKIRYYKYNPYLDYLKKK